MHQELMPISIDILSIEVQVLLEILVGNLTVLKDSKRLKESLKVLS
jgi:hypothetical protein